MEEKLRKVETQRDGLKARAARYKSDMKKAQHEGSADRKMLQEELDDAQRLIAAAMSGDTDGVVEEMKQQKDEALRALDAMCEERDAMRDERDAVTEQLMQHARGQDVPVW